MVCRIIISPSTIYLKAIQVCDTPRSDHPVGVKVVYKKEIITNPVSLSTGGKRVIMEGRLGKQRISH
jgi:hypothetical protein